MTGSSSDLHELGDASFDSNDSSSTSSSLQLRDRPEHADEEDIHDFEPDSHEKTEENEAGFGLEDASAPTHASLPADDHLAADENELTVPAFGDRTTNETEFVTGTEFAPGSEDATTVQTAVPVAESQSEDRRRNSFLITILFTWASLATIVAVLLYFMVPEKPGPLENLPDDGALQEKPGEIVSPLEALSSRALLRVGETKQVGLLEVTPLRVENGAVLVLPDKLATADVLILRLRIRNASTQHAFAPLDPTFLYPDPTKKLDGVPAFDRSGYTYTFIHPAGSMQKLILPFDLPHSQGFQIDGQEFPRLKPGESADVFVISEENAYSAVPNGELVWRVKLRKGLTAAGKGVASVVGVVFNKHEVKTVDGS